MIELYILLWYVIGVLSCIGGLYVAKKGEVTKMDIVESMVIGFLGPIITISVISNILD